jgi:hypothetical protein
MAVVRPPDPLIAGSSPLYVVGGRQPAPRPLTAGTQPWYEYEAGVVLRLDPTSGAIRRELEYVSPPDAKPVEGGAVLFKSGTLRGDVLYACTQTEVMAFRVPSFERFAYVSLPQFNDLHHVLPTPDGTVLVADTGLDMVLEVTWEGAIVREWPVLTDEPLWTRFSRDVDYRRVPTTKPHLAHPNHLFYLGAEPWATRFQQRDAISLNDPSRRIDIGLNRVHDGVVRGDRVYFTTVDGKIVIADTAALEVLEVIDLDELHGTDTIAGWCRGIHIDGDIIWVGFSRIRPTAFRENVSWVLRGFRRDFGTHVAAYDLRSRRCLGRYLLEDAGFSAVFGIFPVPAPAS